MRTAVTAAALLIAAAIPSLAWPIPPVITYDEFEASTIEFVTPGIYDFSRTDQSTDGEITETANLFQDVKGRLTGFITTKGDGLDLDLVVKGSVKVSAGMTVLTYSAKGGGAIGNGDEAKLRSSVRAEVQGLGPEATLVSTTKSKNCVKLLDPFTKKTTTICNSGIDVQVSDLGNAGMWQVRLVLERNGKSLIGAGHIRTSPGDPDKERTSELRVSGAVGGDGIAKIKLVPVADDGVGQVTLIARVADVATPFGMIVTEVLQVKGKLLGQRFNEALF